jgi:hypothetical protein
MPRVDLIGADASAGHIGALTEEAQRGVELPRRAAGGDLRMHRDAAEHLSFAVRHYATTGTTAQQIERAKQRLAEARKHVAAVTVKVSVDGAEVLVDGASVGRAPLESEVFVEPGARVIEARLAGHTAAKAEVQAEKGGSAAVTLTLTPLPVAGEAGPGPAGGLPPRAASRIEMNQPATGSEIGETRGGGPRKELLIVGGALAGAGLITGVVLAVIANSKSNDAEAERAALVRAHGLAACSGSAPAAGCASADEAFDTRDALSNAAFWSFVGAGAIGLATGAYALLAPRSKQEAKVSMVLAPGPRGGGLAVGGTF